jgi:hypothetical protein
MKIEIRPEDVTEVGKMWDDLAIENASIERRLAGISNKELLQQFSLEELLQEISTEDLEAYLQQRKKHN